jgi:hypothetical protein
MNIQLSRTEKIQKFHAHAFAGLAKAQQNQVFANALFSCETAYDMASRCKWFNGMLRVIVVPWNPVKTQISEQLVSVFFPNVPVTSPRFHSSA